MSLYRLGLLFLDSDLLVIHDVYLPVSSQSAF